MLIGVAAAFFYIFSFILIASALMVVFARNPVHSVLFLILAFFNAAALFLLAGAEFLAMILLIVYVGAFAVIFLFVVMMLDIDFVTIKKGIWHNAPLSAMIGIIFFVELIIVVSGYYFPSSLAGAIVASPHGLNMGDNTQALGDILYTQYVFYFQIAGLILLVAMIGAIILTLRHKPKVKRQSIHEQVTRTVEDSIEIRSVKSGKGI